MPENKANSASGSDNVGEKASNVQRCPSINCASQACARDDQRQKAEHDLIQSWQARLQLISVITTFFATMEAQLLGFVIPVEGHVVSTLLLSANAILSGAFAIHISAAILSFLTSFCLITFRLKKATEEELHFDPMPSAESKFTQGPWGSPRIPANAGTPSNWTMNPLIERVGPFHGDSPTRLLEYCHTLCILFSLIGFVLALVGGLCYSWARLPQSASIVASVCLAVCWSASSCAVFLVL